MKLTISPIVLELAGTLATTAPMAQPKPQVQDNVAILDFESRGVSEDIRYTLSEKVRQEMVRVGKYTVVDRGNMEKVLEEWKIQVSECTDQGCRVEVGRILGVGKIVSGSVSKLEDKCYLSANLTNVETGVLERVADEFCYCGVADLFACAEKVTRKVIGVESSTEPQSINEYKVTFEEMKEAVSQKKFDSAREIYLLLSGKLELTRMPEAVSLLHQIKPYQTMIEEGIQTANAEEQRMKKYEDRLRDINDAYAKADYPNASALSRSLLEDMKPETFAKAIDFRSSVEEFQMKIDEALAPDRAHQKWKDGNISGAAYIQTYYGYNRSTDEALTLTGSYFNLALRYYYPLSESGEDFFPISLHWSRYSFMDTIQAEMGLAYKFGPSSVEFLRFSVGYAEDHNVVVDLSAFVPNMVLNIPLLERYYFPLSFRWGLVFCAPHGINNQGEFQEEPNCEGMFYISAGSGLGYQIQ